jgi:hypothetical protein
VVKFSQLVHYVCVHGCYDRLCVIEST